MENSATRGVNISGNANSGEGGKEMVATIVKKEKELREIRFVFRADGAQSAKLAGTFTDWEARPVDLERTGDGEWSAVVELPVGEHQYKFLVDGEWVNDPNAQAEVWNDIGTTNSWVSIA